MIVLIVVCDKNGVIGKGNMILWCVFEDLVFF